MNKGIWFAVGTYIAWGLLPVYWKWLQHVQALQLISHRVIWSCLMLCGAIILMHRWGGFRTALLSPRVIRIYLVAALLIGVNWLTYVWAVNAGFIVQPSLGYFINPLVSVLLAVIFLHERLRHWQWVAIGLAAAGVAYLTIAYGSVPWIALILAFTFGTYGLIKKTAPLGSLYGLTLETGILLFPAILYLLYCDVSGQGAFLHTGAVSDMLMVGAGFVTMVPLLMFATAAHRIPLSLVGILQYIAPTLQFLIGVLIYREPFTYSQFIGFSMVWAALIIFGVEGFLARRVHSALTRADSSNNRNTSPLL